MSFHVAYILILNVLANSVSQFTETRRLYSAAKLRYCYIILKTKLRLILMWPKRKEQKTKQ